MNFIQMRYWSYRFQLFVYSGCEIANNWLKYVSYGLVSVIPRASLSVLNSDSLLLEEVFN